MTKPTSIGELLASYNAAASKLGRPAVKRFADRKTAERRTAAILGELPRSAGRKPAKAKNPAGAAAAIAASWRDPAVFAARLTRHEVSVDGVGYKSTRAAFAALDLPMGQHIRFRMALKAAGKTTGFGHNWELAS